MMFNEMFDERFSNTLLSNTKIGENQSNIRQTQWFDGMFDWFFLGLYWYSQLCTLGKGLFFEIVEN